MKPAIAWTTYAGLAAAIVTLTASLERTDRHAKHFEMCVTGCAARGAVVKEFTETWTRGDCVCTDAPAKDGGAP